MAQFSALFPDQLAQLVSAQTDREIVLITCPSCYNIFEKKRIKQNFDHGSFRNFQSLNKEGIVIYSIFVNKLSTRFLLKFLKR